MTSNIIRSSELTSAEIHELALFCDGPITQTMVDDKIRRRGVVFTPDLGDMEHNLRAVRGQINNTLTKVAKVRARLVEAVANADVSPAHESDRFRRIANGIRNQVTSAQEELDLLISYEASLAEKIEAHTRELLQAAE